MPRIHPSLPAVAKAFGLLSSAPFAGAITIAALVPVVCLSGHLALRGRVRLGEPPMGQLRLAALATLLGSLVMLAIHFAWTGIAPWEARP